MKVLGESVQQQYGLSREVPVVHHGAVAREACSETEQKEAREDLSCRRRRRPLGARDGLK